MENLAVNFDNESTPLANIGSLKEVVSIYDLASHQLKKFSRMDIDNGDQEASYQDEYNNLHDVQASLLLYASNLRLNKISEAKELLEFWHKSAILERTKEDISHTDLLVISVLGFLQECEA